MSPALSRIVAFVMIAALCIGSLPFISPAGAQEAEGTPGPVAIGEEGAGGVALPDGTLPGDPQVQLVKVADGLIDPVNVATANDGSGRLFVVERVGYLRIVEEDGTVVEEPFLDDPDVGQDRLPGARSARRRLPSRL